MDRTDTVFDEIKEEHLDMMIRFALKQADAERLLDDNSIDEEPVTEEEAQETYELFLRKLKDQQEQKTKEERKLKAKNILKYGINAIICVILCLAIVTPIAIASIAPLREYVSGMLVNIKEDHIDITLSVPTNQSVPEGWNGKYYPMYVPDRYHLARIYSLAITAVYIDDDNNLLYYTEGDQNETISIDSENSSVRYEIIGTKEVLVVEKEGFTTFVWHNDERLFTISGKMSIDEATNMLGSMVRVY